jgi:Family of unknown function (DUF5996)
MAWEPLPYDAWRASRDTLHSHTQVLGKVSLALAPPEPELQHGALRLTVRGWETAPLAAPDGSGAIGLTLDLRTHEACIEHHDGRGIRVPLTPNRAVADVTRDVLAGVDELVGEVTINMSPQETPWSTPLDEDTEHATYDVEQIAGYFGAATEAALVLAEYRAPFRGRSTPVNAWWGSFDLAVNLFSGMPAEPPSQDFIMRNSMDAQEIAVGWWPGDHRYPHAALYAYAHPSPVVLADVDLPVGRWDAALGEFILDWDDVVAAQDPHATALEFCQSFSQHACHVCGWDPTLASSVTGKPAPVR